MHPAASKRNKAAGTLCAQIYQCWCWRCAPRRHTHTHAHIYPTYTHLSVAVTQITERNLEYPQEHRQYQRPLLLSSGARQDGGPLATICTFTRIFTYLFLCLYLPIYTGIHSLSLKDDWTAARHDSWGLLSHLVSGDDVSPGTDQGGAWTRYNFLGGLHLGSLCILMLFSASAGGLMARVWSAWEWLGRGLFGLSLLALSVCSSVSVQISFIT